MAAPTQILDLDSLVDRPVVVINGTEYELLTPALLPPLDAHRYDKWSKRAMALMEQPELTEAEETELDDLPRRMCGLVLEAPGAVLENLTSRQSTRIIATFIRPPQTTRPVGSGRLPENPAPLQVSTGETSSPV